MGASDNHRLVKIRLRGLVELALLGSQSPTGHWNQVVLQGSSLVSLGTPAATATVGTQLGEYCAAAQGVSSLNSDSGQGPWRVSVVVG